MHASSSVLKKLDVIYHAALWFVTDAIVRTHHCNIYEMVQWTSLCLRRKKKRMYIFIAKALLGKLLHYISSLQTYCSSSYNTRSSDKILLMVPTTWTELGKSAFSFNAPQAWNELQSILNLKCFPSLGMFKNSLKTFSTVAFSICHYFPGFFLASHPCILCVCFLCSGIICLPFVLLYEVYFISFCCPSGQPLPGRRDIISQWDLPG